MRDRERERGTGALFFDSRERKLARRNAPPTTQGRDAIRNLKPKICGQGWRQVIRGPWHERTQSNEHSTASRPSADPTAPAVRGELATALASKTYLIVAKAAALAGEFGLPSLAPELIAAFERFVAPNGPADTGCAAKAAVAQALYEFGTPDAEAIFLRGVRHVQMEPTYGGSVDVAATLRGTCALALVRIGYRDAMLEVTDLLADPEPQARIGAARALAYAGQDAGTLLLRLKILTGDAEADVTAECMSALARLAPRKSVPFLGKFLGTRDPAAARFTNVGGTVDPQALRDAAALALGESRQPEAFELLRHALSDAYDAESRRPVLLAIATLRLPGSLEFLLSRAERASPAGAAETIEALGIYRRDDAVRARLGAVAARPGSDLVARAFAKAFPA